MNLKGLFPVSVLRLVRVFGVFLGQTGDHPTNTAPDLTARLANSIACGIVQFLKKLSGLRRNSICSAGFGVLLALILFGAAGAARAGNQVLAWGAGTNVAMPPDQNDFGQSLIPTNLSNAVFVAGGWRFALALKADATIQGWGDDSFFQQDFPTNTNGSYVTIAAGQFHSLALDSAGFVTAVGDNFYNQTPAPAGLSNVVAISCGFYHSLVLKSDGTVAAWGAGMTNDGSQQVNYGQSMVPTNLSNVVAIAGGARHSLALKSDGTVTAWGAGTNFDPGDGVDYGQSMVPTNLSNVVAIAAGAAYSVALKSDGTVLAWGDNTYGETNIPVGLSNVIDVVSGGWHALALKSDGTVVAWGAGVGSNPNVDCGQTNVPPGLTNVLQIAAGSVNSLALVGTAPPVSSFLLTSPVRSTNGFRVSIPAQSGHVYRLEYKNALTNGSWTALPLVAGVPGTLQLTDPSTTNTARFYRVRRW